MGLDHDLFHIAQQPAGDKLGEVLAGKGGQKVGQLRARVFQVSVAGAGVGNGVGISKTLERSVQMKGRLR